MKRLADLVFWTPWKQDRIVDRTVGYVFCHALFQARVYYRSGKILRWCYALTAFALEEANDEARELSKRVTAHSINTIIEPAGERGFFIKSIGDKIRARPVLRVEWLPWESCSLIEGEEWG